MASTPTTQRDIAAARDDRTIATATAAAAVAPAGTTGTDGWDSDADRDAAVLAINTNRTRIAEIITALEKVGILLEA
jgi:hypothetical protein